MLFHFTKFIPFHRRYTLNQFQYDQNGFPLNCRYVRFVHMKFGLSPSYNVFNFHFMHRELWEHSTCTQWLSSHTHTHTPFVKISTHSFTTNHWIAFIKLKMCCSGPSVWDAWACCPQLCIRIVENMEKGNRMTERMEMIWDGRWLFPFRDGKFCGKLCDTSYEMLLAENLIFFLPLKRFNNVEPIRFYDWSDHTSRDYREVSKLETELSLVYCDA